MHCTIKPWWVCVWFCDCLHTVLVVFLYAHGIVHLKDSKRFLALPRHHSVVLTAGTSWYMHSTTYKSICYAHTHMIGYYVLQTTIAISFKLVLTVAWVLVNATMQHWEQLEPQQTFSLISHIRIYLECKFLSFDSHIVIKVRFVSRSI